MITIKLTPIQNLNSVLASAECMATRAVNVYPGSRLTEGWYLNGS